MSKRAVTDAVLSIFLVEPHPDTQKYLRLYLEEQGHTVYTAGTFYDTLASVTLDHCDVLISDIGLPDSDGWELLRQLRDRLGHGMYAVAMSGCGPHADHRRSQEAGYRHHLLKPFSPCNLNALLHEAARERT